MSISTPAFSASAAASVRSAATPWLNEFADGVVVADDDARRNRSRPRSQPRSSATCGRHRDAGEIGECRHDGGHTGATAAANGGRCTSCNGALGDVDRGVFASRGHRRHRRRSAWRPPRARPRAARSCALKAAHLGLARSARRARGPRPGPRRCAPSADRAPHPASARRSWRARRRAASMAASRAVSSQASGSNSAASASGTGKQGAMAVDDVEADEQRNARAATPRPPAAASRARASAPTMLSRLPMVPALMASVESPAMTGPVTA